MKSSVSEKENELFKIIDRNAGRLGDVAPVLMQINRNRLEQAARKVTRLITKNNKSLMVQRE